jgi:hypothetical protein
MPGEPQGEREGAGGDVPPSAVPGTGLDALQYLLEAVMGIFEEVRPTGRDYDIEAKIVAAWRAFDLARSARGAPDAEPSDSNNSNPSLPNPPEVP